MQRCAKLCSKGDALELSLTLSNMLDKSSFMSLPTGDEDDAPDGPIAKGEVRRQVHDQRTGSS